MQSTDRQIIKPSGLARFLVAHGECEEGFETLRDRKLITVVCRGCDASFSFLTRSPEGSRRDVEAALVELAEASGPEPAHRNGSNGSPPEPAARNGSEADHAEVPVEEKPIHTPPARGARVPALRAAPRHRPLPPPGPLAPRHHTSQTAAERLARSFQRSGRRLIGALDQRRRPVALAALGLAGVYVLIGLMVGGEPSSSQSDDSLGGPQVPVAAPPATPAPAVSAPAASAPEQGSAAESAQPAQAFPAGGSAFGGVATDGAQFSVVLPAAWGSNPGPDGRTLLGPLAGGAEIQVVARPREDLSIGQLADEATASLAEGTPSVPIDRLAAQPAGNLLQVARAATDGAVRSAYIGLGESTAYLVIAHLRKDASALVRLETQGVLSSFVASG